MRPLLALVAGFVVSLGMFAFGAGFATWLLMAEPVQQFGPSMDVAGFSTEPVVVDTAAQDFRRVPGPAVQEAAARPDASRPASTDKDAETAATVERAAGEGRIAPRLSDAHVEWCAGRYRSYRVSDNSYAPYSGGRRPCVSPYSEEMEARAEPPASDAVIHAEEEGASVEWASAEAPGLDGLAPGHVADCFSRYRSYRPEDNTYQPYGGGPRRQCR